MSLKKQQQEFELKLFNWFKSFWEECSKKEIELSDNSMSLIKKIDLQCSEYDGESQETKDRIRNLMQHLGRSVEEDARQMHQPRV